MNNSIQQVQVRAHQAILGGQIEVAIEVTVFDLLDLDNLEFFPYRCTRDSSQLITTQLMIMICP